MKNEKQMIREFRWHERYMAIDWQTMKFAFVINWPDGGAKLLIPSTMPGKPGVQAAISSDEIHGFIVRRIPTSEYVEVVLEVSYSPGEKSLGLTKQTGDAEKWAADANKFLNDGRTRKST